MSINQELKRGVELDVQEEQRSIESANQNSSVARIVHIVYFLFALIEVLLGLRVVLRMLDANASNGFANFIYGLSQPFVILFANLFSNPAISQGTVLELTTITAMVAYAILAWLIGRIIWLTLSRPR